MDLVGVESVMTVDDLADYGVERMDEDAVHEFLAARRVGVLGLPTDDLPYMVPISYGFDGEEYLYFTYVVGGASQKTLLTEEKRRAGFLVYDAASETQWTSVALEGTLSRLDEHDIEALDPSVREIWTPAALKAAKAGEETRMYRFWIQNERGITHSDVPPGFVD